MFSSFDGLNLGCIMNKTRLRWIPFPAVKFPSVAKKCEREQIEMQTDCKGCQDIPTVDHSHKDRERTKGISEEIGKIDWGGIKSQGQVQDRWTKCKRNIRIIFYVKPMLSMIFAFSFLRQTCFQLGSNCRGGPISFLFALLITVGIFTTNDHRSNDPRHPCTQPPPAATDESIENAWCSSFC